MGPDILISLTHVIRHRQTLPELLGIFSGVLKPPLRAILSSAYWDGGEAAVFAMSATYICCERNLASIGPVIATWIDDEQRRA
jgi:hypothetical protein